MWLSDTLVGNWRSYINWVSIWRGPTNSNSNKAHRLMRRTRDERSSIFLVVRFSWRRRQCVLGRCYCAIVRWEERGAGTRGDTQSISI